MNLARFATKRIKAILFFTVALCVMGLGSLSQFPISILPDITFPRIVVIAESGERPARMMEIGVARPLEEAIATVPGVTRVRSKIQRGAAELSVDFAWGTDMLTAQQLISAKVNEARGVLPTGTNVTVERMNPTVFPVAGISVHSKTLSQAELWSLATYTMRPRLGRVSGVARAVVQGGRIPEILVEVDPKKLAAYGLSLPDVEMALSGANIIKAAGRLDAHFQQYQVLVSGETTSEDDLARVVVTQKNGVPITLPMLATLSRSLEDQTTIVTAEGVESVLINIVRQPEANTLSVVSGMQAELASLRTSLPPGTEVSVFYDQSILIGEAIGSVRDAVLIGAGLAVVVLLLFLGDWRATLVTAAIIPATVFITFLLMRISGLTLNLMTLGALAIGIGLVIDDAIVVVENVFRHLAQGLSRSEAVIEAANEIGPPMISSTLTTVVVFLPLIFLSGVAGAFFTALALTLTISLLVSLALALTVSPSACAAFLKTREGQAEHGRLFEKVLRFYDKTLRNALQHRWILPVGMVIILASTAFFGTKLGTGFMPTMDEGAFILDYHTPPGTSLTESNRLLFKIEEILKETPEIASFSRRTGTELGFAITETNRGDFAIMLKSGKRRPIEAIIEEVRGKIEEDVPGVDVEFVQVLQDLIGDLAGAASPIEVKLFSPNQATLEKTATGLKEKLATVKGTADVQSGVVESGPELVAHVDPLRAGRYGLTSEAIASQVTTALAGTVATQVLEGDRQISVRVRLPQTSRDRESILAQLPLRTPTGANIPLSSVATLENVAGTSEISHEDQRRLLAVTSQLEGRDLGSVVKDVQSVLAKETLPAGVTAQIGGQYKSQTESFQNLVIVLCLAILLVFTVMIFQFGRFTAPLVILFIMPLSLFGVTLGLYVTHTLLNVSSFMGAVMLVGIVVKNGILLLDHAQKAEELHGLSPTEAVVQAGEVRLRPILMTTLTAILGLLPLALGLGAGAQMQQPLAIAVIGGLTFSTIFTLIFAPMLYVTLRGLNSQKSNL